MASHDCAAFAKSHPERMQAHRVNEFRARPLLDGGIINRLPRTADLMNAPAVPAASLPDEDFFRALEVERTQALVSRDIVAIRRLHTPEYELISVPGRVLSLERYLSLMAIDVFYASWEHGPMRVQVSAEMAAVRYQAKITFPSGKVIDCWHTDIYKLLANSWQAAWSQATQLPPEPPSPVSSQ